MNDFVIISGCSGGGKSALVDELARRGHSVVPEPGRRIVQHELAHGGGALPWRNPAAFAKRAIEVSLQDLTAASVNRGWTFFDRGLIDAAAALAPFDGGAALAGFATRYRFHQLVFLAPPWPELHVTDRERQHDFAEAKREYARLEKVYPSLGYDVATLPKAGITERADFVLRVVAPGLRPPPPAPSPA
jgi:predicted ATPase